MSAETLRKAAALMRERAEARMALPKGASICRRSDHPARRHGHYGYSGAHWCSDFNSPLLSEENMGSRQAYAKPVKTPDTFMLAVADLLEHQALDAEQVWHTGADVPGWECACIDCHPTDAVAIACAYLGGDE